MRTQTIIRAMALLLACTLIAGCGGSQGLVGRKTGRAALTIVWPVRSRLIPYASNSIQVSLSNDAGPVATQVSPRPAVGGPVTIDFENLPVGSLTVVAAAYPNSDGTGVIQAQATTSMTIVAGQTASLSLTMASTIDHLETTPSTLVMDDVWPQQLTLTARDAYGNVVLISPTTVTWTSSNPAVATVDQNGNVRGFAGGTAQIMAIESESGKSVTVSATVQVLSTLSVYTGPTLSSGFDLILNTSGGLTNWLTNQNGDFEAQYPPGQQYGFIAITTYPATANVAARKAINLSGFNYLLVDMKGANGGENVAIGIKTEADPDDGDEPVQSFTLTSNWQTYQIPLKQLVSANYPASRFTHIYVVCEFVFEPGVPSETIFFQNVRYGQ